MNTLVIVILLLGIGTGVTAIWFSIKPDTTAGYRSVPDGDRLAHKKKRFLSALLMVLICSLGLANLLLGILTAYETLVGVMIVLLLCEVAVRNWKTR